jgi:hypothetical protein
VWDGGSALVVTVGESNSASNRADGGQARATCENPKMTSAAHKSRGLALAACLVVMTACTDHSDVTLDFRVSSVEESGRVCVQAIDRTYKGYDSCYLVAADMFRTLSGREASCVRAHVQDPLQPENRDQMMAGVQPVSCPAEDGAGGAARKPGA